MVIVVLCLKFVFNYNIYHYKCACIYDYLCFVLMAFFRNPMVFFRNPMLSDRNPMICLSKSFCFQLGSFHSDHLVTLFRLETAIPLMIKNLHSTFFSVESFNLWGEGLPTEPWTSHPMLSWDQEGPLLTLFDLQFYFPIPAPRGLLYKPSLLTKFDHKGFSITFLPQFGLQCGYLTRGTNCSAVAQSIERLSKVPVWWKSTDMSSNHATAFGGRQKVLAIPYVVQE